MAWGVDGRRGEVRERVEEGGVKREVRKEVGVMKAMVRGRVRAEGEGWGESDAGVGEGDFMESRWKRCAGVGSRKLLKVQVLWVSTTCLSLISFRCCENRLIVEHYNSALCVL